MIRSRLALAIVLLMAVTSPGRAEAPEVSLRQADQLVAADRLGEAEKLYKLAAAGDDRFARRQAYLRLMGLYLRSGRPDKGVALEPEFRTWLREVKDTVGEVELDALLGECLAAMAYLDRADETFLAALRPERGLATDLKLAALRGRAEIAEERRQAEQARQRWSELASAARAAEAIARRNDETVLRLAALRYQAEALRRQGHTAAALTLLEPIPALHDQLDDPVGRRDTQRQRANLLTSIKRYAEATPLYEEALAFHKKHRANRRITTGDILAEWAESARLAGQQEKAATLRRDAETIYRTVLEKPVDSDQIDGGPLAAFIRLQMLTRSIRQFQKALDLSRGPGERWSSDALLEVRVKADRAELEILAASYSTARTLLSQVLAEVDRANPPDLRILPQLLVNLAAAELAGETPDRAIPLLRRCAELYRKHTLPADAVLAECDYLQGASAAQQGDYPTAVGHYRRGLTVCDQVGARAEPVRFNILLNSALIAKDLAETATALDMLSQAARCLEKFAEPDDLNFGLIAAARADLHLSQGQISDAVKFLPTIDAACAKHQVRTGYLWGTARHVEALGRSQQTDTVGAEKIWQTLATSQRTEGQVLLGRTLNHLGLAAEAQGRGADAIRYYEESRSFLNSRPWSPAVTRAITLWRLAMLYDRAGRPAEAKALLNEVFTLADRARLGTFGEAAQRAQFFAQFRPVFEQLIRWHARDGEGLAMVRAITRSRSRTLLDQLLATGVDPRDQLRDPDRDRLLAEEARRRNEVSRLRAKAHFLPADKPDSPAAKALLAELDAAQQAYAEAWKAIINANPVTRSLTDSGLLEGPLLPAGTLPGTAILAYSFGRDESFAIYVPPNQGTPYIHRIPVPENLATTIGPIVMAIEPNAQGRRGFSLRPAPAQPEMPTPPTSPIKAIPMTETIAVRLVDHYLRQIADPEFQTNRGFVITPRESKAPPDVARPELLGDALIPRMIRDRITLDRASQLIIVPDGPLHKLPMETLLLTQGNDRRYALEELPPICYAPSLGMLAVLASRPDVSMGPATLLTVGDPAYPEVNDANTPAKPGQLNRPTMPRLPFTAQESRLVRELFPKKQVTAFEAEAATERNLVTAAPGKRFIHLAAHGFADERFGNLFAAIALTPPPPNDLRSENDGFLTLHEIHRVDLSSCDIAVLSACVTNVGPQRPLEAGVTLAGAFLGAGARRVVATSWSVDDRATSDLVVEFFRRTATQSGQSINAVSALRAARMKVRNTPGWDAPFYWGAFVFVGLPDMSAK